MKFLCVQCDAAMSLRNVSGPDEQGSLAAVYRCGNCSHEVAMLTNAHETQMVTSLGVKIGPAHAGASTGKSCPFGAMLRQESGAQTQDQQNCSSKVSETQSMPWSNEAQERLQSIPEFIRPMVQKSMEDFARAEGCKLVDGQIMDLARARMNG